MILKIDHTLTESELTQLQEEFREFKYIKLVADVETGILHGGSRLHFDCEQILLNEGSDQENIWGGGVDMSTNTLDCRAVANYRPENKSEEILNPEKRAKFIQLVKKYFPNCDE